jgi:hypothetical protein
MSISDQYIIVRERHLSYIEVALEVALEVKAHASMELK